MGVNTKLLNVRDGPDAKSAVSGQLPEATIMLVVDQSGDWVKLEDLLIEACQADGLKPLS